MKNILTFTFLFVLMCSCGKKTNPEPPEFRSPSAVSNLVANATNEYIKLSWLLPTKNLKGKDLNSLEYITIKRKLYDSNNFKELIRLRPEASNFYDKSVEHGNVYDYIIYVSNDQKGSVNNIIRVNYQGNQSKINIIGIN